MKKETKLTKEEAYVLYQVEDEERNPQEIAEILEGMDEKDVKETLSSLKRKKLIELAGKDEAKITQKGKETVKKARKLLFK